LIAAARAAGGSDRGPGQDSSGIWRSSRGRRCPVLRA